jgi:hypothetical protein
MCPFVCGLGVHRPGAYEIDPHAIINLNRKNEVLIENRENSVLIAPASSSVKTFF